jgi:hypothetical protein
MKTLPAATLLCALLANLDPPTSAAARSLSPDAAAGTRVAASAVGKPFEWTGVFDVVGDSFPDGQRLAVLIISRRDTTYDLSLEGPPGSLRSLEISGDSAHVVWDVLGEPMYVDLSGCDDALEGRWKMGGLTGPLVGTRRR